MKAAVFKHKGPEIEINLIMSDSSTPIVKKEKKSSKSSSLSDKKKDPTVQITKVLSKTSIQEQQPTSSPQKSEKKESSKSKPSSSSSLYTSPILPKDPIKILSKNLKFQNYESILKILSKNNTNFTVVSIIGGQSAGKSTILSSLIKRSLNNQFQTQQLQQLQQQQLQQTQQQPQTIPTSTNLNTSSNQNTPPQQQINKNSDFINNLTLFESLTDSNFGLGKHQTVGIDLFISEEERIIYLDTQPLQSLSIMCEMIEENLQIPNQYSSYEHFHHMECLKLVVFLLSVCNIVLVVQENKELDIPLCKLIRTASLLLKNKTPDVSNPTPNGTLHNFENDILESTARQIFIFNKLTDFDMNDTSFDKTLSVLFSNPKNLYQSFISNLSSFNNSNPNNTNKSATLGNEQTNKILLESKCQSMTHFDSFFIPDKYMQEILHNATTEILGVNSSEMMTPTNPSKKRPQQTNTKLQPTFNESIEFLHKHLLLLRSDSKFTHDITERQWFENSSNLWNYIQECDLMGEYNSQLLKSKYYPLNQQQNQQNQQNQHHHHNHHQNQRDYSQQSKKQPY
ncbi:hypothetical protein DICPUDRAFT_76619 [Dictyostelium purpureum]|uniref:Protein SMG9 n=1 Tax=Dictyostelium purpureum TaxID=5786 RepID=F0ZE68_DICPU|nr:uncharacterized protein DICPUDRAFT_76619 [Dictyostelium purpureum]EGC37772.1 hypothetical protein DICPUDRAFT_76619 [Dictyostelium purpureum]|eukprot:XP_003285711.1 hypothetical protein DICPUDRAFT_76619 [Dictyostelium purpureum]